MGLSHSDNLVRLDTESKIWMTLAKLQTLSERTIDAGAGLNPRVGELREFQRWLKVSERVPVEQWHQFQFVATHQRPPRRIVRRNRKPFDPMPALVMP